MSDKKIESLNEEGRLVVEELNEKGEITKITTEGNIECASEKTVDVFEDRKVLARRVTEFVKPITWKVKTEVFDECGNVVDIIIEELDESNLSMQPRGGSAPIPVAVQPIADSEPDMEPVMEPQLEMQSVNSGEKSAPQVRYHSLSYKEMAARTDRAKMRSRDCGSC